VRKTSEDLFTSNVFGILRRLRPSLWLRPMLNAAFKTQRFKTESMRRLDLNFWKTVGPPPLTAFPEGPSEVDVCIAFATTVILLEAKFHSPLATRTTYDPRRDQLVRLLDVAYSYAVGGQLFRRDPYVLVLGLSD